MVHFELGHAYGSQGKSTLPSPLLVAALLKTVSHATIFFLSHYNSPPQEMAPYIWTTFLSQFWPITALFHFQKLFDSKLFFQLYCQIIACILSVACGVHQKLSPMELLFSVLNCNNLTTSIHATNWIWLSLNADYIIILCFPYLQFQFLCFKKTWHLKINNIIWSASKTVKQEDLTNKADNLITISCFLPNTISAMKHMLQVKIKFRLKFFNLGWFAISFVSSP